jgi:hypothetical protein
MIGSSPAFRKGTGAFRKGTGAPFRSGNAPVMSGDGQLILYWDKEFQDNEFLTIQTTASIRDLPAGAQLVGEAYRLVAVPANLDLSEAFINFGYLGRDVPPGQESALSIYYRDEANGEWLPLPTRVDPVQNQASARALGAGLYTLLARLEIPLRPGWNLVGYPLPTPDLASRPAISESLQAIDGHYSIVYGLDPVQPSAPWQVYDPKAPTWANSLDALEFGRGYLIHVREPVTLSLAGGFESTLPYTTTTSALAQGKVMAPDFGLLPALYAISLTRGADLIPPEAENHLTAWVDGVLCGKGTLHSVAATVSFTSTIAVPDDIAESPAVCQGEGKQVEFKWGNEVIGKAEWDNTRIQEIQPVTRSSICHNLIGNGDFEAQGGWQLLPTRIPARILADPDDAGSPFLQLGASPDRPAPRRDGRSIAQQTFVIPTQAAGMTLEFSYRSSSTAIANDPPRALLFDRRGLRQLAALSLPASTDGQWNTANIDLSAFGGRKVLLSFELIYNPHPSGSWVWADVDKVRACTLP